MLKQKILEDLKKAIKNLGFESSDIVLSIPENSVFGDYTTNVAFQLSKQREGKSYQNPKEIANEILGKLGHPHYLERVEIAGAGFINFYIKDKELIKTLHSLLITHHSQGIKYLVEYGHVNPLKEIHIGHLRTFILGESLARILEYTGNKVFRANYQGDIGLHIAKAIWGIKKIGLPKTNLDLAQKAQFLGKAYAEGNKAYEADSNFKKEIEEINIKLYASDPEYKEIYTLARDWSLSYFEPRYELLGIKYDRCFFESEVFEIGKQIVLSNVGSVFQESEGAIIFQGEKYGLHNRVFLTSKGNPTYEAKEVGLAKEEYEAFNYDKAIHVVGDEQKGYFQVVFKALEMLFSHLKDKKHHLSYGMVDIKEGKMSSRTGEVITIDDVFDMVSKKVREIMVENKQSLRFANAKLKKGKVYEDVVKKVSLGAIKFTYLKFSPQTNVIFDLEKSVSFQGDSGPYLQYTFARTQSILRKVKALGHSRPASPELQRGESNRESMDPPIKLEDDRLEEEERELLRLFQYFEEIIEASAKELKTNILTDYLINLAKAFNLFYQKYPVLKSKKEQFRLILVGKTGEILKAGLYLLGIEAPEKM